MDNERHAASKRDERAKKEDVVLNRILVWFGAAVVAEFVLLWLGRYYSAHSTASEAIMLAYHLHNFMEIFRWVSLGLFAVCAVWLFLALRGGKRAVLPKVFTALFGVVCVMSFIIYQFSDTGIQFLCRAVLGVTELALIFYLYQKEFFTATLAIAGGILGLWVVRKAEGGHALLVYGYLAALAVLLVLVVLLCRAMQKSGGVWKYKGKELRIFSKNAGFGLVYLTCGLVAAAVIAAVVGGPALAYYLMFALVAWVFVMAVYYTVKLM